MSWPNGAMRCDVMPTISEDGDQSVLDEHSSHDANIEQVIIFPFLLNFIQLSGLVFGFFLKKLPFIFLI